MSLSPMKRLHHYFPLPYLVMVFLVLITACSIKNQFFLQVRTTEGVPGIAWGLIWNGTYIHSLFPFRIALAHYNSYHPSREIYRWSQHIIITYISVPISQPPTSTNLCNQLDSLVYDLRQLSHQLPFVDLTVSDRCDHPCYQNFARCDHPCSRISLYVRITCSGSNMLQVIIILIFITVTAIDGLATAIKRQNSNTGNAFFRWFHYQSVQHSPVLLDHACNHDIMPATKDLFMVHSMHAINLCSTLCMLTYFKVYQGSINDTFDACYQSQLQSTHAQIVLKSINRQGHETINVPTVDF